LTSIAEFVPKNEIGYEYFYRISSFWIKRSRSYFASVTTS